MFKGSFFLLSFLVGSVGQATISSSDRVYTADENSNTVSVISPETDELLGQISLGHPRKEALRTIVNGEINVHGLIISPDHKTMAVVSTVTNSVTFVETATNKILGKVYIGRNPHSGCWKADGSEVWVAVRGEDYLSVIDPKTMMEIRRIQVSPGPANVLIHPDGKTAYVVNSYHPTFDFIEVKSGKVRKTIPVEGSFSPVAAITPDGSEIWTIQKDLGKIARISTKTESVIDYLQTGRHTQHVTFCDKRAFVTVGGHEMLKVYRLKNLSKVKKVPMAGLPHGVWAAPDCSKIYVGMEFGDQVVVVNGKTLKVSKKIQIGQSPQTLLYVSGAAPDPKVSKEGLTPLGEAIPTFSLQLEAKDPEQERAPWGHLVIREIGPSLRSYELRVNVLTPQTKYLMFRTGDPEPWGMFETDPKGVGRVQIIVSTISKKLIPFELKDELLIVAAAKNAKAKDWVLRGSAIRNK